MGYSQVSDLISLPERTLCPPQCPAHGCCHIPPGHGSPRHADRPAVVSGPCATSRPERGEPSGKRTRASNATV